MGLRKEGVGREEAAAYAPLLGVEVVGARTYVLREAEALAAEAHLYDAARRVCRQREGFALQIANGIVEGEVDTRGGDIVPK